MIIIKNIRFSTLIDLLKNGLNTVETLQLKTLFYNIESSTNGKIHSHI